MSSLIALNSPAEKDRWVRIGLVAPGDGVSVRALEEAGIDSLWVGGHIASPRSSPEPIVWLARLVEQSERVLVGTATLVLPWYPPAVAAKQLADLHRAAGGRIILGVGAGGEYPEDFVAAGVPMEERGQRLNESIELLRAFWTADPVYFSGQHFNFQGLRIRPSPGGGGPPIVITGRRKAAMQRAASLGDGWMPYLYSAERYARSVATIENLAANEGRTLADFHWMAYVMVAVDDSVEKARQNALQFLGRTWDQNFDQIIDRVAVVGTIESVVEQLVAFVTAGARHLVLLPCTSERATPPWLPDLVERVRKALREG